VAATKTFETQAVSAFWLLTQKGVTVFVTSQKAKQAHFLPMGKSRHPLSDPISVIASFYAMVETVAVARGINPDPARHLSKVIETV
jgi:glucosamine--fructose-6-phosphate aminotransferase (isomerizing)